LSVCWVLLVSALLVCVYCLFFFQAEDGIRDRNVTGVQTCALPICRCQFSCLKISFTKRTYKSVRVLILYYCNDQFHLFIPPSLISLSIYAKVVSATISSGWSASINFILSG